MTDHTKAIKDALEAGVTDCGAWRWWPCKAGDYKPANDYAQLASGQAQVAQIRIQSVTEADLRYIAACSPHAIRSLLSRLEEAGRGSDRYETVRRMNPQAFLDAYILNQRTGKPFDEVIDDLKPFVRPAAMKEQSK